MTVKHVLTGRKHDKLGNQTFEVLQPLKRTVHTIPLTYFTYWSSSRHLNYFISKILGQRNTWFEVSAVFVYRKHRKLSNFGAKVCLTAVELQMFGYQACHVCAQLEHVFFCHVSTLRRKRRYFVILISNIPCLQSANSFLLQNQVNLESQRNSLNQPIELLYCQSN